MKNFTLILLACLVIVSCKKEEQLIPTPVINNHSNNQQLPELSDLEHLDDPEVQELTEEEFLAEMEENRLLAINSDVDVYARKGQRIYMCIPLKNGWVLILRVPLRLVEYFKYWGATVLDEDGDFHTASDACFGSKDDCNDLDASINPSVAEVCGNGIDDDCDGTIDEGCTVSLAIGDNHKGGIIVYIDNTGDHGIVVTETDVATPVNFDNAVLACDNLVLNGYSDWTLPDTTQLQHVFNNQNVLTGISIGEYWSSVEFAGNTSFANSINFQTGDQLLNPKFISYNVRAVRNF